MGAVVWGEVSGSNCPGVCVWGGGGGGLKFQGAIILESMPANTSSLSASGIENSCVCVCVCVFPRRFNIRSYSNLDLTLSRYVGMLLGFFHSGKSI